MRCGLRRERNGGDVLLHQPAQRDLRDAAPARRGNFGQHRIAEQPAAPERTIGDEDQLVPPRRGQQLRLVEKRMILRLQYDQRLGAEFDRLVEQRDVEIGDADMARQPLPLGLGQRRHGLAQRNVRIGPMDQQEIDVIDLERGEAFIHRFRKVAGAQVFVADLGGEEDVLARARPRRASPRRPRARCRISARCRYGDSRPSAPRATVSADSPPVSGEVPKPSAGMAPPSAGKGRLAGTVMDRVHRASWHGSGRIVEASPHTAYSFAGHSEDLVHRAGA